MEQRKRYAIASGAALLLALGGAAAVAGPALADAGPAHTAHAVQAQAGHEDGTNDGETADDVNDPQDANDPQGANEADEANEQPGTETDDDVGQHSKTGHEDGKNDGETADDAGTGR